MKKIVSLLLCLVMILAFSVCAVAYEGENYIQFSSEDVTIPKNQHIAGDSNGDGKINVLDVMASVKYIAGNKSSSLRDSIDTDCDGKVTVTDVLLVLKHVLGENVGLGDLVD